MKWDRKRMQQITSEMEWSRRRREGAGYFYNDFSRKGCGGDKYNVLHAASCRTLAQANLGVAKYFSPDLRAAVAWLNAERGAENQNWRRCGTCGARQDRGTGG